MVFKVEFEKGSAVEWHLTERGAHLTERGARPTKNTDYSPTIFVDGSDRAIANLEESLRSDPKVESSSYVRRFVGLGDGSRIEVLRIDLDRPTGVRTLAREIRHRHEMDAAAPGTYRLYNVDLSPQFRYCVETGTRPTTNVDLSTFSIRIGEKALAEGNVSKISVQGEDVSGHEPAVLKTVATRVRRVDPDVLVVSDARLVPLLFRKASTHGIDSFELGRRPGYIQLAGSNSFVSYGRVGHSPARYDVPGRVIVDESNSFLWSVTNMDGLLDLVAHSWKPLQELAWASIGNVLTAIQIREAIDHDVLVPWNKWEPEGFKDVRTLHAADRGGFTFAPDVGVHEDVVEVDFSSLYPRIMVTRNISPDTICCDCHADRADVPELGYSICDRRGFLADVLEPLLDHRSRLKARIAEADDPGTRRRFETRSNAIKWILVSCFGYQGYRNSKFGRIECHEAINAVARDVLLTAKEICEDAGWRVTHGIVDSLWLSSRRNDHRSIESITDHISETVGIPLETEARYDWVAFVPKRDSNAGALTKYFGKVEGRDEFKIRGIEARQRPTPTFVADAQLDLIEAIDGPLRPEPACDRLESHLAELRAGRVSPTDLEIRTRVSKSPGEYDRRTHTTAALRRAERHGVEYPPGRDVRYVIVDDDARNPERVRLHFEEIGSYDVGFYESQLLRVAESVLSPFGWDRGRIESYLDDRVDVSLDRFREM